MRDLNDPNDVRNYSQADFERSEFRWLMLAISALIVGIMLGLRLSGC